ncbi:MAG: hypothetical protein P1U86_15030 [Verrucomicrobiales bacterium]|nr:hypothetical protein [Verrucomicrobiales bacterium]
MEISIVAKAIEMVVDEFGRLFRRSRIVIKAPFVEWEINTTSKSIDKRIEKLDDAREALSQGLDAIDELRTDASRHKNEVKKALEELSDLSSETAELEAKKDSIAKVLDSEVSAFRDVAGIPSEVQRRRDKVLGFVSGVIASMVASGLIYAGVWGVKTLTADENRETNQVEQAEALKP